MYIYIYIYIYIGFGLTLTHPRPLTQTRPCLGLTLTLTLSHALVYNQLPPKLRRGRGGVSAPEGYPEFLIGLGLGLTRLKARVSTNAITHFSHTMTSFVDQLPPKLRRGWEPWSGNDISNSTKRKLFSSGLTRPNMSRITPNSNPEPRPRL